MESCPTTNSITNSTHCYHEDGAARGISYIKDLADWTGGSTKVGSLRKSIRHLACLQANKRHPLIGRTGTYDFGKLAEDQAVSTQAYLANGLRGNSDAYRHARAPSRGGQLFWCEETDRQKGIANLSQARLVQFGITMDTMFQSAAEMNRWFAEHWPSCQGPGVHALLFTTHAMFIRGELDSFSSLSGGGFDELDSHLGWVRKHYPDVEFATASDALCEYLDYYTPTLQAHTEARRIGGDPAKGQYEFPVRLLGRGIRVSPERPATVRVAAPPCFSPEEILMMRVWQGDRMLASRENFDPRYRPELEVALTDRNAPLRLEVQLRSEATTEAITWFGAEFYDCPEAREPDLLRLRSPVIEGGQVRIWPDLVRALMNPIAGHSEPFGRRVHPLGAFTLGAALTAALTTAAPNSRPVRIQLRWLREVDLHSVFSADSRLTGQAIAVRILDGAGALVAMADVEVETPDMQADLNA